MGLTLVLVLWCWCWLLARASFASQLVAECLIADGARLESYHVRVWHLCWHWLSYVKSLAERTGGTHVCWLSCDAMVSVLAGCLGAYGVWLKL